LTQLFARHASEDTDRFANGKTDLYDAASQGKTDLFLNRERIYDMSTAKNILVTGASSGIGEATARGLSSAGHHVVATARRVDRLRQLADNSQNVVTVAMDVTDPQSVRRAVIEAGPIDVLVNNAGFAAVGPIETIDFDEARRQFDVNVFGLLDVTRAVLPQMRERRRGRIVNISSVVGRTTFPGTGIYGASKYAVEALSDAMRAELAPFGIDVAIIEPSFVRTEITENPTTDPTLADGAYEELATATGRYLEREVANGADPSAVARLIVKVIDAPRPRTRYLFPAQSRLLVGLFDRLPDRAGDKMKRRAIGIA
jgi:NADP-dependent 3-hydroxy acid dehydrogenase YdfG